MKRANAPATKVKKSPAVKKSAKAAKAVHEELQAFISAALDKDKALDIVSIPLKGKTIIADYMLIATGTSSRHVSSMAQKLCDKLKSDRKIKARLEGKEGGDWVIVDAGDVMVHLFREEVRSFYNLEKLWGADFSTANYTRYQSV